MRELEQLLASARGESDRELAKQLSELAVTERLSEMRLRSLAARVRWKRAREELRILADSSTFLDPPADEIPVEPPPNAAAQQRILLLASAYLSTTTHRFPDLLARQTTVRYQETPMYRDGTSANYQPLHVTDSWTTTVRYRNGFEIAEAKPPKRKPKQFELITYGVFGPGLKGVLDAKMAG